MIQLFGMLIVAALFVKYFWWLVAAVTGVWLVNRVSKGWVDRQAAERARLEGLRARADQQLEWWLSGDPRGTYGEDTRERDTGP